MIERGRAKNSIPAIIGRGCPTPEELAETIMADLKNRFIFDISKGTVFKFRDDVEIITLENLRYGLEKILEERLK